MADPRPHVGVVRHDLLAGIRGEEVEPAVLVIYGEVLCALFELRGDDRVRVVGDIFERELVAEHRNLVVGQLDGGVLMPVVHLDVPRFLLVGDEGDVHLAAAVGIEQSAEHLDRFARGLALADDEVDRREFGEAGLDQGIGGERFGVRERRDRHDHRDAVFIRADGRVLSEAVHGDGAVHPRRRGVAVGGGGDRCEDGGTVVDRHGPSGDVFDPFGHGHVIAPCILIVVGFGEKDGAVRGDVFADIDGGAGEGGEGCKNESCEQKQDEEENARTFHHETSGMWE